MKNRAFTLLEVLFATVLGVLIMIGSVGFIENIHAQISGMQASIDNDMNWVEANNHLGHMVRSASYLEIPRIMSGAPDINTLILYNYDMSEKGRYVNNTAMGRLEYYINNGGVLQASFPSAGSSGQNRRLNATFSYPAGDPDKGMKSGRHIEAVVNYTIPITSTLYLVCKTSVPAQSTWALAIGGIDGITPDAQADRGWSIQRSSNGYIICGQSDTIPGPGGTEPRKHRVVYLVNLARNGTILWSTAIGAPAGHEGWCSGAPAVREIFDYIGGPAQGFIVAGWNNSFGNPCNGNYDVYINKFNADGTIALRDDSTPWTIRYGRDGASVNGVNYNEHAYDIRQVFKDSVHGYAADGYIIAGTTNSFGTGNKDFYILRINENGDILWARTYGGAEDDVATSVDLTYDTGFNHDGYIISGYSRSFTVPPASPTALPYIIKIDLNGNLNGNTDPASGPTLWSKTFGAVDGSVVGYAHSISRTLDRSSYLVSGVYGTSPYLMVLDADGSIAPNGLGGESLLPRQVYPIRVYPIDSSTVATTFAEQVLNSQNMPDGYIMSATVTVPAPSDHCLIRTDGGGIPALGWPKTFGFGWYDYASHVTQTFDGGVPDGYIVTGKAVTSGNSASRSSDIYVVKTNLDGECPQANNPTIIDTITPLSVNVLEHTPSDLTSNTPPVSVDTTGLTQHSP